MVLYRRFSEWKTLASKQDNATKLNKVYKAQINSIDLDVDNSDVEIKRGSTFSIKEKGNSDKKINSDVKMVNGILVIKTINQILILELVT